MGDSFIRYQVSDFKGRDIVPRTGFPDINGYVEVWQRNIIFINDIILPVVNWHKFVPTDFEYDFENDKLSVHGVMFEEAVQCFFSNFEIRRNKSYEDRYQLIGRTSGGRYLKIIFQLKPNRVVRIITGWPI